MEKRPLLDLVVSDSEFKSWSDIEESTQSLTDDEAYFSALEDLDCVDQLNRLEQEIERGIDVRTKETVVELQSLKEEIEDSYDKSRKAKIGGTVASVVGSGLGITGFGLAFVTFGASLPLLIVGIVVGAAGGATIAGADIGYLVVSSKQLKTVNRVCQRDYDQMREVHRLSKKLEENLEELCHLFPHLTKDQFLGLILERRSQRTGGLSLGHSIHLGLSAVAAVDMTRIGTQIAARTVWRTLNVAGKVVGVVGVAFDVVLVPIDIALMVKAAVDIHKYNGGKGTSNSNAAQKVQRVLDDLNKHTENMKAMYELIKTIEP